MMRNKEKHLQILLDIEYLANTQPDSSLKRKILREMNKLREQNPNDPGYNKVDLFCNQIKK